MGKDTLLVRPGRSFLFITHVGYPIHCTIPAMLGSRCVSTPVHQDRICRAALHSHGVRASFETSFRRETHRPSILVRVNAQGLSGWGECVVGSGPWYSAETLVTARHILADYLIPRLLQTPLQSPRAAGALFRQVRGHSMAKAVLENALWDLWGRMQGVSLSRLLGRHAFRGACRSQRGH